MFQVVSAKHYVSLALLVLLSSGFSSSTHAHVGLATTVPDHDQVLERAPTQIHFQFMAQVTLTNLRLEITGGEHQGERIELRLPRNSVGQSTAFGESIDLALPELDASTYLVTYQAVSIDGHIMIDDFSFTVLASP